MNGVETKIVGIRKNLKILKLNASFFVIFTLREWNLKVEFVLFKFKAEK